MSVGDASTYFCPAGRLSADVIADKANLPIELRSFGVLNCFRVLQNQRMQQTSYMSCVLSRICANARHMSSYCQAYVCMVPVPLSLIAQCAVEELVLEVISIC